MGSRQFILTDDLLATKGQRILNYIIDVLIIYILIISLTIIVSIIATLSGSTGVIDWLENTNNFEGYLIFFLVMIPYFAIMETLFSKTIAKYITKTIVVNHDGSKPDNATIIKRTFCRIIPFDNLSFLGDPSRGWHDTISDTYVVKKQLFDEKQRLFNDFEEIGKDIAS